ncbi:MAG: hypothetical protein NC212_00980 [Staphylococcus sp.]|nr:hypothetical protein [Staphylococcus sp.]
MKIKTVTRNLNFDTTTREPSSKYRVRYGNSSDFNRLVVVCNHGGKSKIFETDAANLPKGKDSIHFHAEKTGNTFVIKWCGNAGEYMMEV